MTTMVNEIREGEGNVFVKEKIMRLQKSVRRNEKYKKSVYTILWREGSNKIDGWARLRVQSAFKGHGFIDKASRKGYDQTPEQAE